MSHPPTGSALSPGELVVSDTHHVVCEVLPYAGLTQGALSGTFVRFLSASGGGWYDRGDEVELSTEHLHRTGFAEFDGIWMLTLHAAQEAAAHAGRPFDPGTVTADVYVGWRAIEERFPGMSLRDVAMLWLTRDGFGTPVGESLRISLAEESARIRNGGAASS